MRSSRVVLRPGMARAFFLMSVLFSACSIFGPGNIQTRHSSDIESRKIKRIAVIPPTASVDREARVPFTSPRPIAKYPEREAPRSAGAPALFHYGWSARLANRIRERN